MWNILVLQTHMDRKVHKWKVTKSPLCLAMLSWSSVRSWLHNLRLVDVYLNLKGHAWVSFKHHIMSTHDFQYLYFTSAHQPLSYQYINISPTWIPPTKKGGECKHKKLFTISWILPLAQYASPHALGHLPSPCSMKNPTFIHNIKLGWSSTTGSHIYSH